MISAHELSIIEQASEILQRIDQQKIANGTWIENENVHDVAHHYREHLEELVTETEASGWKHPTLTIFRYKLEAYPGDTYYLFADNREDFDSIVKEMYEDEDETVTDIDELPAELHIKQETEMFKGLWWQVVSRDKAQIVMLDGMFQVIEDKPHGYLVYTLNTQSDIPLETNENDEKLERWISEQGDAYVEYHPSFSIEYDLCAEPCSVFS